MVIMSLEIVGGQLARNKVIIGGQDLMVLVNSAGLGLGEKIKNIRSQAITSVSLQDGMD